jgi:hypothetical protein
MKEFGLIQTMTYDEDCKEPEKKGYQDIVNYPFSHGGSYHSTASLSQFRTNREL